MYQTLVSLCMLLIPLFSGARLSAAETPLSIGSRRELFVDRYLIGSLDGGAALRLHAPVAREKVLTFEKPWEGIYSGYMTVIQDDDRYRMYYRGLPAPQHSLDTEVTCYAESPNGIEWTKPSVGLYQVDGTSDNNVIVARHRVCHNFAPFKDANPASQPGQRYKALGGTGEPGLVAFVSPDGIHWQPLQAEPVITQGAFDSQNVAFWSETEQQYVCYFRVFRRDVRWIARATSQDFIHWTDPVDMQFGDLPPQHLYTNQTMPYVRAPHIYLGMPTRFFPGRRSLTAQQIQALGTPADWDYANDCADIVLTSTRGGDILDRTFMDAWIRPGLDPRNWTSRANYAVHGIVLTGEDELSFYVSHNLGYPTAHVRRYTLRPDGFASVNAPFAGGELVTKLLTFDGHRLTINFATSAAGSIRLEIQDASGQPLPGFTLADCPEIIGDQIDRVVSWQAGADVGALQGVPIRLRFVLQDADLFAIKFQ